MKSTDYATNNEGTINYNNEVRRGIRLNVLGKRLFDLIVAGSAGIVVLPVIMGSAAAIKLFSPGPAFFVHERIGYQGKPIQIWKLRTMHSNSQELLEQHLEGNPEAKQEWQNYFKLKNDPRIIPVVGHFLRKTSMDELPQLWNVLKGDMSIVGPRPFPKYHLDAFSKEFQYLRKQVVPGLTGLWQVSARSDGDTKAQEALDRQYIAQRSFWLDMKIIIKTAQVVVLQRGAC